MREIIESTNKWREENKLPHSETITQINPEFFHEFDTKELLVTFKILFENAIQQEKIVDISEPDYDVGVLERRGESQECIYGLANPIREVQSCGLRIRIRFN